MMRQALAQPWGAASNWSRLAGTNTRRPGIRYSVSSSASSGGPRKLSALSTTIMESNMLRGPLLAALFLMPVSAFAQTSYAGMQTRPIKAISEQQMAELRAGRGMGLALAAELNGYPGPSHVLELADRLELSAGQRASMQRLFDSMKAEAMP